MALTLTANIGANDDLIPVTGTVPADVVAGYVFRLGNELLAFQAFDYGSLGMRGPVDPQRWHVLRGLGGTVKATHTAGTTVMGAADTFASAAGVTPPSPWSSGGSGIPQGGPLSADLAAGGFKITGLDDPESAQDAATRAYVLANAGGGGTLEGVYVPIAFDTANLIVQSFPIIAIDDGTNSVTIDGDHRTLFPATFAAQITGNGEGNDGTFHVVSATLAAGDTVIVLQDNPLIEGGDFGNLVNTGSVGVEVVALGAGDVVLFTVGCLSVPFAWDGSSPAVHIDNTTPADRGVTSLSTEGLSSTDPAQGDLSQPFKFPYGTLALRTATPTTFVAWVDDGSYGDPGSTEGEAIITLTVFRAP